MSFKNRLFFAEKDTANIWYGGVAHIQGELVKFPVDRVHARGGNIVAMGSMTIDAGDGVDDLFVIAMSSGAVLIYQGTDISVADRFALRGIYQLGAAVGDRPFVQLGGDLIMICADGFVPLSTVPSDRAPDPAGDLRRPLRRRSARRSASTAATRVGRACCTRAATGCCSTCLRAPGRSNSS